MTNHCSTGCHVNLSLVGVSAAGLWQVSILHGHDQIRWVRTVETGLLTPTVSVCCRHFCFCVVVTRSLFISVVLYGSELTLLSDTSHFQ